MSKSLIKNVFSILGTLLVSLLIYSVLFTSVGQQFMWQAIEPAMEDQWRKSTMNNGVNRTEIYEESFNKIPEYSGEFD